MKGFTFKVLVILLALIVAMWVWMFLSSRDFAGIGVDESPACQADGTSGPPAFDTDCETR